MVRDGALAFVVSCEDRGLLDAITALADRVATESVDWIDRSVLDAYREWRGVHDGEEYHRIEYARRDARAAGLRIHGHFEGLPATDDAQMYRALLLLVERCFKDRSDVALFVGRDMDGRSERRKGFEQALAAARPPFAVFFAAPEPESQAWVVCGFEPSDADERATLATVAGELGFHANHEPHRLTSRPNDSPRDAKRICKRLVVGAHRRGASFEAPWPMLEARGAYCGLGEFVRELRARLPALFGVRRS